MQKAATPDNQEHLLSFLFRNARVGEANKPRLSTLEVFLLPVDLASDLRQLPPFCFQLLFQFFYFLLYYGHLKVKLLEPGFGLLEFLALCHQGPQVLPRLLHFLHLDFGRIL